MRRKEADAAFSDIVATDQTTLLELSRARDLAAAQGRDRDGHSRFLPILIQGPTGTGKELLARAIHTCWLSTASRSQAPFVPVHVAGMPPPLVADELFGHSKGAFTGATSTRDGKIRAADGGSLFIDEVGDLPAEAQARLLRVLEDQRVARLGEDEETRVSVRILAATWQNLDEAVRAGKFREDLLHRLRVGSGLLLPALAARTDFFEEGLDELLGMRGQTACPMITHAAREALAMTEWLGNLRELVGVIDEAVFVAGGETLRVEHLPPRIQRAYCSLPLRERARAYLLDEAEGQPLREQIVLERVRVLENSLLEEPPPPAPPILSEMASYLDAFPDPSPEHRLTRERYAKLLASWSETKRWTKLREFWASLTERPLPEEAIGPVRAAHDRAAGEASARNAQLIQLDGDANIWDSPWVRLLQELRAVPLLANAKQGEVAGLVLFISTVLRVFAPQVTDEIRRTLEDGHGLDGVRSLMLDAVSDEPPPSEKIPASQRDKEFWVEIAEAHTSLKSAAATAGYSTKTVRKYFSTHNVTPKWSQSK